MFWQDSHYCYKTSLSLESLPSYVELLAQSNLNKGSLKIGQFGQVAIIMKRLDFPNNSNLIRLMGF